MCGVYRSDRKCSGGRIGVGHWLDLFKYRRIGIFVCFKNKFVGDLLFFTMFSFVLFSLRFLIKWRGSGAEWSVAQWKWLCVLSVGVSVYTWKKQNLILFVWVWAGKTIEKWKSTQVRSKVFKPVQLIICIGTLHIRILYNIL